MYTLLRAYARPQGVGNRLTLLDTATVGNTSVTELNGTYRDLKLVFSHQINVDQELLFDFANQFENYLPKDAETLTLNQWLVKRGNASLPTKAITGIKTLTALVGNPFDAGYHVDMTTAGARPNASVPRSAKRDLLITHETVPPKTVYDNVLVSVNGFLHPTNYSDWGLAVKEGGRTVIRSNLNLISLVSFANLGGVTCLPLTPGLLSGFPSDPKEPMGGSIYINAQAIDWSNKTALLCLGGRLIPLGKVFSAIGPGEFRFEVTKFPLLEHFYEADRYIDLESVKATLSRRADAPSMMAVEEFYNQKALTAYFTLPQSFIVAVNSPGVFVEENWVETTQAPGTYLSALPPTGLLVNHLGRVLDYHLEKELERYVLYTDQDLIIRRQFANTHWRNNLAVDSKRPTVKPFRKQRARLLTFGLDTFV